MTESNEFQNVDADANPEDEETEAGNAGQEWKEVSRNNGSKRSRRKTSKNIKGSWITWSRSRNIRRKRSGSIRKENNWRGRHRNIMSKKRNFLSISRMLMVIWKTHEMIQGLMAEYV